MLTVLAVAASAVTFGPVEAFKHCNVCPEAVVVRAGTFRRGDLDGSGSADERPVNTITIARSFGVGKYETTFAERDACATGGGCDLYRPDDERWGRARRPVINVSGHDAKG